jgi:hypothetical protein
MTARGIQISGKVADSVGWLRESHPGASLPMREWIQLLRVIMVEAPGIEPGAGTEASASGLRMGSPWAE